MPWFCAIVSTNLSNPYGLVNRMTSLPLRYILLMLILICIYSAYYTTWWYAGTDLTLLLRHMMIRGILTWYYFYATWWYVGYWAHTITPRDDTWETELILIPPRNDTWDTDGSRLSDLDYYYCCFSQRFYCCVDSWSYGIVDLEYFQEPDCDPPLCSTDGRIVWVRVYFTPWFCDA